MKKINNKGFTFIELVIYIGILSVFMVAVVTMIGSTVSSNRKMTARKKLQNTATETYDAISDMLQAASDVMVYGTGTLSDGSKKTGFFVIADTGDEPNDDGVLQVTQSNGQSGKIAKTVSTNLPTTFTVASTDCYDIADVMPYSALEPTTQETTLEDGTVTVTSVASSITSDQTYITPDTNGYMYIYIKYASSLDSSDDRDTVYTYCTIVYDENNDVMYINKTTDTSKESVFYYTTADSDVLCKDVSSFKLQVDADSQSFSLILDLEDETTSRSYSVSGIVSLRNSYVLTKHTWS